jgi:hypothetical protein
LKRASPRIREIAPRRANPGRRGGVLPCAVTYAINLNSRAVGAPRFGRCGGFANLGFRLNRDSAN